MGLPFRHLAARGTMLNDRRMMNLEVHAVLYDKRFVFRHFDDFRILALNNSTNLSSFMPCPSAKIYHN